MSSPETPLIFLDIDGVLNAHDFDRVAVSNRIDSDKVVLLNMIIRRTGAKVALSSAWRYLINRADMNLSGLDWLLRSHGLKAETLVGITHADTPVEWDEARGIPIRFMENERALQVSRFRANRGHTAPYVVIDDLDLGFTAAGHPFVQPAGDVGLTYELAWQAIGILTEGRHVFP